MPRTYKPQPNTKRYKKYDPDILQKALLELATTPDVSLGEISKKYDIHQSVLYRHGRRKMKPHGGQTALRREEEDIIENINKCANLGYPMDTMDLRYIVKMYLDKLGIVHRKFKNNLPGPDFVRGFLKRHNGKIKLDKVQRIANKKIKHGTKVTNFTTQPRQKGKGKGKKLTKQQEFTKEVHPSDTPEQFETMEVHENEINDVELQTQDNKPLPVIFFEDLIEVQEVIIKDEMCL